VRTLSLSSEKGSVIREFRNSNAEKFEYHLPARLPACLATCLPTILINKHFIIKNQL